uniref:Protein E16A n=1 Tax=Elephant endotheliotropic herpesvirus 1A TaxID=759753 RepID=A0A866VTK5_ELHV1|nr:protein E16A [Elephant endotheliotropic herpesvirus 1A]
MLSSAFIKKLRLTKELITLFFLNQYPVHGANITLQSLSRNWKRKHFLVPSLALRTKNTDF